MKSPRERYLTDTSFRMLVDFMIGHIRDCNYTPSEMRDAALLAFIKHEQIYPRAITYPTDIIAWLDGYTTT